MIDINFIDLIIFKNSFNMIFDIVLLLVMLIKDVSAPDFGDWVSHQPGCGYFVWYKPALIHRMNEL